MKTPIKTTETFYQNLGKLFYAVAFADKHVREEEFSKLQLWVRTYWLDYDALEDVFGEDAAYLIEIVFEGAEAFKEPAERMYNDFVSYKRDQPQLFTKEAKALILDTAKAIAKSFSGLNKSELIILGKLELELQSQ